MGVIWFCLKANLAKLEAIDCLRIVGFETVPVFRDLQ